MVCFHYGKSVFYVYVLVSMCVVYLVSSMYVSVCACECEWEGEGVFVIYYIQIKDEFGFFLALALSLSIDYSQPKAECICGMVYVSGCMCDLCVCMYSFVFRQHSVHWVYEYALVLATINVLLFAVASFWQKKLIQSI